MAEDGIEKAIAEIVGSDELTALYRQIMQTTDEMPYDRLRLIGLQLEVPGKPYITASFTANKGVVVQVSGPGQDAGLKIGDKVVSLSPVQLRPDGQFAPTQEIRIERGSERMTIALPVLTETGDRYQILLDPSASSEAVKYRAAWLKRGN